MRCSVPNNRVSERMRRSRSLFIFPALLNFLPLSFFSAQIHRDFAELFEGGFEIVDDFLGHWLMGWSLVQIDAGNHRQLKMRPP